MKNLVILCYALALFYSQTLSAKAFHLLIMGDTKFYKDSYQHLAFRKDVENIQNSFSYLSSVTKVPIYIKILTTDNQTLTRSHVMHWIRKEPIAHDDIVIFYYTGHGAREPKSPTIWPFGCFLDEKYNEEGVEFSKLLTELFSRNAALYLALFDCCNVTYPYNVLSRSAPPGSAPPDEKILFELSGLNDELVAAGCQELFFKSRGIIIASGASPSESGWSNPSHVPNEQGGVFTKALLNNFFKEVQSSKPMWSHVLKKTREVSRNETKKARYQKPLVNDFFNRPHCHQTPQYKIFLHKKRRSASTYNNYLFKRCVPKELQENITDSESIPVVSMAIP